MYTIQYEDGDVEEVSLQPEEDTVVLGSEKPVHTPWSQSHKRARVDGAR
jgi:hypothetical protein